MKQNIVSYTDWKVSVLVFWVLTLYGLKGRFSCFRDTHCFFTAMRSSSLMFKMLLPVAWALLSLILFSGKTLLLTHTDFVRWSQSFVVLPYLLFSCNISCIICRYVYELNWLLPSNCKLKSFLQGLCVIVLLSAKKFK
jgi:hypothetical protein